MKTLLWRICFAWWTQKAKFSRLRELVSRLKTQHTHPCRSSQTLRCSNPRQAMARIPRWSTQICKVRHLYRPQKPHLNQHLLIEWSWINPSRASSSEFSCQSLNLKRLTRSRKWCKIDLTLLRLPSSVSWKLTRGCQWRSWCRKCFNVCTCSSHSQHSLRPGLRDSSLMNSWLVMKKTNQCSFIYHEI